MLADLHLHTNESDGTWSPTELVHEAIKLGLSAIAITDHDTTAGINEALAVAPEKIEVIPGIELSSREPNGEDVHILGLWIDPDSSDLNNQLAMFKEERIKRNGKILSKLNKLGININEEDVLQYAHKEIVSRSHIASALVNNKTVRTKQEAFDKFLTPGAPTYVERKTFAPEKAIELILNSGGVPVLAHPGLLNNLDILPSLVKSGLVGLEVIHSTHTKKQTEFFLKLAKGYNLLPSGGSDCHGPGGKDQIFIGKFTIPFLWKEALFNKATIL